MLPYKFFGTRCGREVRAELWGEGDRQREGEGKREYERQRMIDCVKAAWLIYTTISVVNSNC